MTRNSRIALLIATLILGIFIILIASFVSTANKKRDASRYASVTAIYPNSNKSESYTFDTQSYRDTAEGRKADERDAEALGIAYFAGGATVFISIIGLIVLIAKKKN